ncbi:MAG TPA: hypothetical protein VMF62_14850 [Acetobacteraceae bacterium]|jgi:type IV pilus biogenesis protein CpaD/CtpE|nr:hypothetical protein [Acetobacteraceae bacterium]
MPATLKPLVLLVALAAGGCTMTNNPVYREGTWHPTGANEANLAAEVANPHDLVAGESAAGTPGPLAVLPVESLRADKVKPLPSDSIDTLGGTTTPSTGGASAGTTN